MQEREERRPRAGTRLVLVRRGHPVRPRPRDRFVTEAVTRTLSLVLP
jgi:hypothetical protein